MHTTYLQKLSSPMMEISKLNRSRDNLDLQSFDQLDRAETMLERTQSTKFEGSKIKIVKVKLPKLKQNKTLSKLIKLI